MGRASTTKTRTQQQVDVARRKSSRRLIQYRDIEKIFDVVNDTVRGWACGARSGHDPFPNPARTVGQSSEFYEGEVIGWGVRTKRLDPNTLAPKRNTGGKAFNAARDAAVRHYHDEYARLTADIPAGDDLARKRADLLARQATAAQFAVRVRALTRWIRDEEDTGSGTPPQQAAA